MPKDQNFLSSVEQDKSFQEHMQGKFASCYSLPHLKDLKSESVDINKWEAANLPYNYKNFLMVSFDPMIKSSVNKIDLWKKGLHSITKCYQSLIQELVSLSVYYMLLGTENKLLNGEDIALEFTIFCLVLGALESK